MSAQAALETHHRTILATEGRWSLGRIQNNSTDAISGSPLSMFDFTGEPRAGHLDSESANRNPSRLTEGRGPIMSYPLNVVIHNILKEWEWRTGSPA